MLHRSAAAAWRCEAFTDCQRICKDYNLASPLPCSYTSLNHTLCEECQSSAQAPPIHVTLNLLPHTSVPLWSGASPNTKDAKRSCQLQQSHSCMHADMIWITLQHARPFPTSLNNPHVPHLAHSCANLSMSRLPLFLVYFRILKELFPK